MVPKCHSVCECSHSVTQSIDEKTFPRKLFFCIMSKTSQNINEHADCPSFKKDPQLHELYMVYWERVTFWSVRELHGVLGESYLLVC